MPNLKKCPDCAELVQAEARRCRYCGFIFTRKAPNDWSRPGREKGSFSGTLLAIVVILFVVAKLVSDPPVETSPTPVSDALVTPYAPSIVKPVRDDATHTANVRDDSSSIVASNIKPQRAGKRPSRSVGNQGILEPAVYYANCSAARAAGAAPVRMGEPGYAPRLDRDGDGVGCE